MFSKGFTLIETMLILVVIGIFIFIGMGYNQQRAMQIKIDKQAIQMQQVFSAAISYYLSNGAWPNSLNCLKGLGGCTSGSTMAYLPPVPLVNIFNAGAEYGIYPNAFSTTNFYIESVILLKAPQSYVVANVLAGLLPMSYTTNASLNPGTCTPNTPTCHVFAGVTAPGQNLANAAAINFAGLYHSGACVPVPGCPPNMQPSVIVTPVAVTGAYDPPNPENVPGCNASDTSGCVVNAYPLNSFTATATDKAVAQGGSGPADCSTGIAAPCYTTQGGATINDGKKYWRVCISIMTSRGQVPPASSTDSIQGQVSGTVMAVTRCAITGEPSGSDFTVWSQ